MKPPATRIAPVTDTLHGVDAVDNYRWLEGDNTDPERMGQVTPNVAAWTDEQNAHTRAVLDALPGRKAIEDALRPLMEIGAVTAPIVAGGRYFYSKREGTENQPVFYYRDASDGPDYVLIDPAKLDATGLTTIEWISPSQDGRLVAYGTYRSGDENTTLHVLDVGTLQETDLTIPDKTQAPFWLPDASGFVYQNLKNWDDPYSGQVLFHAMGTPVENDPVLFRQFTKDENEALATTWGPAGSLSRDGKWLFLSYWIDTKSNDAWLVDFDAVRATGQINKVEVSVGRAGHISGEVIDGTLFIHTTKGAPKGRLVAASPHDPGEAHWRDVVPERDDAVIEAVTFGQGAIVVTYMKNASNVVEVFDMSGQSIGVMNQPGIGAVSVTADEDRTEAFLTFTSFNYPTSIFRVDLSKPGAAPVLWAQPQVPIDPATVEVEQVWYPSKDGTKISMFVIHKKGMTKTGTNPAIVTAYGGFNISETPVFAPTWFQWFDAGGLIAVPNVRGGGEYGDAWHEGGMLERKQNVFDDFHAGLEWLIANKYTCAAKLAISGGSNGGLLTGAAVTQRPDLFRAAIVAVPLLDMLRYQDFLMARYWVPEYGSAEVAEQFEYLRKYSPYHRVRPGTKYPAVFLTAGENDTRVHAMHARKMAAALQAATVSDPATGPVLLWVDREAGHGQGKPLNLRIRDAADQRAFIMWQLGILKETHPL